MFHYPCMSSDRSQHDDGFHGSDAAALKRLDLAIAARQFEIRMFWRRALYFLGLSAAAFAAFAALIDNHPNLAALVAGFGLVASVIWTLANRGSKYWQEIWETRALGEESASIGVRFDTPEPPQNKGIFSAALIRSAGWPLR